MVEHNKPVRCCRRPRTSDNRNTSTATTHKEETILKLPGASVHLLEPEEEPVELARGDLLVLKITEEEQVLATVIKVGNGLQWPLTKDEPVVKVDELHYLFSLPDKDGGFLNYGVSFSSSPDNHRLASLGTFLRENSCYSTTDRADTLPNSTSSNGLYWSQYATRIGDYNKVIDQAIAGGTGQVVKGIFTCSNLYSRQVQKGAKLIQPQDINQSGQKKVGNNSINKSIRRVRQLSELTEKMSRSLLNGVLMVTGIATLPVTNSKAGKAILGTFPGNAILASLDAVNKVLDAIEGAERKTIAATGGAVSGVVSKRFGENAGQATEDLFATAGHTVGTAWNIFKIRKALTPSSSLPSSMVKNAVRKKA